MARQTYFLSFSDPSKDFIEILPGTRDSTSTTLTLHGQAAVSYGDQQQENFLHLLENFARGQSPQNPVQGQLWFDSDTGHISAFDDFSNLITAVTPGSSQFTIGGVNIISRIFPGEEIEIVDSVDNDGTYTIADIEESGGDTVITVNETITSSVVAGSLKIKWIPKTDRLFKGQTSVYAKPTGLDINVNSSLKFAVEDGQIYADSIPFETPTSYDFQIGGNSRLNLTPTLTTLNSDLYVTGQDTLSTAVSQVGVELGTDIGGQTAIQVGINPGGIGYIDFSEAADPDYRARIVYNENNNGTLKFYTEDYSQGAGPAFAPSLTLNDPTFNVLVSNPNPGLSDNRMHLSAGNGVNTWSLNAADGGTLAVEYYDIGLTTYDSPFRFNRDYATVGTAKRLIFDNPDNDPCWMEWKTVAANRHDFRIIIGDDPTIGTGSPNSDAFVIGTANTFTAQPPAELATKLFEVTAAGQTIIRGGDVDTPGMTFFENPNTGWYYETGVDQINGTISGTRRWSVNSTSINAVIHDFAMGHESRRGTPGRALVDETTTLTMNFAADWQNVFVNASGGITLNATTQINGNVNATGAATITGNTRAATLEVTSSGSAPTPAIRLAGTNQGIYFQGNGDLSIADANLNICQFNATDGVYTTLGATIGPGGVASVKRLNRVDNTSRIYSGRIGGGGTAVSLPTGWGVSLIGTGHYRLTHNQGTSAYTFTANSESVGTVMTTVSWHAKGTNSIDMYVGDTGSGFGRNNVAVDFILMRN